MYFLGIGTVSNTLLVVAGGLLGLLFRKGIKQDFCDSITKVLGVAVIFVGAGGALSGMLKVADNGSLETQGTILMILSLVLGMVIGELLQIEKHLDTLGEKLKSLLHSNDSHFVDGFVSTTLIICVGAMAVVGSLEDGLAHDPSMLYAKGILDFAIVLITASTLGIGSVFSALPLLIYQGAITLLAGLVAPYLTETVISNLSYIGSVLIFCTGINLFAGKQIKVGNMLPALIMVLVLGKFM